MIYTWHTFKEFHFEETEKLKSLQKRLIYTLLHNVCFTYGVLMITYTNRDI